MYRIFFIAILALLSFNCDARTLRVFAIGNSFSQDAIEQNLYELALAGGDTLIVGNAYIPGCNIDKHLDNIVNDKAAYSYRKVVDGVKNTTDKVALSTMLNDEKWDVISLQQASHFSGLPSTYSNLPELKSLVVDQMPREDAKIVWHMTWAYAKTSEHSGFKNYGYSQDIMNDNIYYTVCTEVADSNSINQIIPAGPAIQNAREIFGDVLNSDGYHLSPLGRYVAACTWYEFLTGKSVVGNSYHPDVLTDEEALNCQQAAHKAMQEFKVVH